MKYTEVCAFLDSIQKKSNIKFGLDTVRAVLTHRIFPRQGGLQAVQVGGTNGKGSTCYYLSSILVRNGVRTGLFLSPHLVDIRERILINFRPISARDFARVGTLIIRITREMRDQGVIPRLPTYFEYLFLIAIYHFHSREVDLVILEVGLGGRLDATSAITPVLTVVTRIALDHEKYLGNTRREIAREKAGIVRQGIPVVSYHGICSAPGRILRREAARKKAPFLPVPGRGIGRECSGIPARYRFRSRGDYRFSLKNDAPYLARNAACAIRAAEWLDRRGAFGLSSKIMIRGISDILLPGRLELIQGSEGEQILLDIAHNPDGFRALSAVLKSRGKKDMVLVYGVLAEKNFKKMLDKILRFVKIVIITKPISPRACDGRIIGNHLRDKTKWEYHPDIRRALARARGCGTDILVTGSFYLVGPVKRILAEEVQGEQRSL